MSDVINNPNNQVVNVLKDEVVLLDALGFLNDVILSFSIFKLIFSFNIRKGVGTKELQSLEINEETITNLSKLTNKLFKEEVVTGKKEDILLSVKQAITIIAYKKYSAYYIEEKFIAPTEGEVISNKNQNVEPDDAVKDECEDSFTMLINVNFKDNKRLDLKN